MRTYKYRLDKSSKKYLCPSCGRKSLVRYVDSVTSELQPEEYGKCDREVKCGFLCYPKTNWVGSANLTKSLAIRRESHSQLVKKQVFIPRDALVTTLGGYSECTFFTYLSKRGVPDNILEKVILMYFLGTIQSGHLHGALTIPYINEEENIAFVQVKQFNELNSTIKTSALHSLLKGNPANQWVDEYEKNDLKVSCFFGAHLLKKYPNNPIALVEAPKTAIYGTCYLGVPHDEKGLLWLAVYNKSSLTEDKFKALRGRTILVFPDLSSNGSTYNEWKIKVEQFARKLPKTKVLVNDFLERYAPVDLKQSGGDFADYLSKFTWQEYQSGCQSVKSVKNDAEKKHFLENALINETSNKLENFLQPNRGYSMKEIIVIASDFEIFHKLNDLQIMSYLIEKCVIKQDFDRDNYYRFDSIPF